VGFHTPVEITQQGDVDSLGKTEATTRCGSEKPLPPLDVAARSSDATQREQGTNEPGMHFSSLGGLTACSTVSP